MPQVRQPKGRAYSRHPPVREDPGAGGCKLRPLFRVLSLRLQVRPLQPYPEAVPIPQIRAYISTGSGHTVRRAPATTQTLLSASSASLPLGRFAPDIG